MSENLAEPRRRAHSIEQVCALTSLGREAVYTAVRDGRLVARKVGRRTIVTDDDLRQFLAGLPRAGGHEQASAVLAQ
jgi:excisionase family DNA binding protein